MIRMAPWRLVLILALAIRALPAQAERFDIVVSQRRDSIELYVALPATDLVDVVGGAPGLLADRDERIDLPSFQTGTYDLADALFAGVAMRADGRPIRMEAMSMMLHPAATPLPLLSPLDGMIAMSVCGVPLPEVPPSLAALTAYVGLIAQIDGPVRRLGITLPGTEAAGRRVWIVTHGMGGGTRRSVARVSGDGRLTLAGPWGPPRGAIVPAAGLAAAGATGLLLARRWRARRVGS